ncbi:hypothetical protein HpCK71_07550 [Helicobacter pylori]
MGFFRVIRNAPIASIFIVLMLIFCAWFFLYDDSSPKAVKKYVKGKFSISDYLYKKADKKEILPQNNVVKQEIKEEEIKKSCKGQITDSNGNLIDDDCNIIATQKQVNNLPNLPKDILKTKPTVASNSFNYNTANEEEKTRLVILASRISSQKETQPPTSIKNSVSNTKYKEKQELEKEYGSSGFKNFKRKNVASSENKLLRTITADRMIPAILITPISSEIGGSKIVAQVESDIYATMGRAVLIPKGSRAIGYYNSNNKIGEYRLEIAWNRIITPQGVNIILSDAKGSDVKGYNGMIGTLHNKYWERYGIPLSLSTLSNGLLIGLTSGLTEAMKNKKGGFN